MKRFFSKHYHFVSFFLLVVIFTAWLMVQEYVLPPLFTNDSGSIVPNVGTIDPTANKVIASGLNVMAKADDSLSGSDKAQPEASGNAKETPNNNVPDPPNVDDTAVPTPLPEQDDSPEITYENIPEGETPSAMPFDICLADVNESLNVRSGPDEKYDVIAKFLPSNYAHIVEKGSSWSKITSGSITGYAHNDYLITGSNAIKKLERSGKLIVKIMMPLVNIRASKSTSADVLGLAKEGETYTCIWADSDSHWLAIKLNDGTTAYVGSSLCTVLADLDEIYSLTPMG